MLAIDGLEVVYNRVALVLKGVSLSVARGSVVALLGGNGAGKTTTLRAVSGLLAHERGEVVSGSVSWMGESLVRLSPDRTVKAGVVQVLEGRRVFEHLTVDENLLSGAFTTKSLRQARQATSVVYDYFPRLADRRRQHGGLLSGGEQQMLAIGRALMSEPSLLLLDEPSLGLSPIMVSEIFEIITRLNVDTGLTVLMVEQNAEAALSIAHHGYVLENGRVVLDGTSDELRNNQDVSEFYLGLSGVGERKSYRDVKTYRRRKRWLG
ncbi:ABC transporter ATP-binding protein [Aeromicrobium piscarium]|uniref:ABC transporter ATP-binding protein n=1 Tax=Aeromicrobium piscarium TaxID=2590901 RepID=A0A554S7X9_9ACTN|nr:ABC transporter ATP-binding protein [Aeromicrobium piscarium]